jgi:Ni,Fe-hydrogenase III large subunit
MAGLSDLIQRGQLVERHAPWPRAVVDAATWRALAEGLAAGESTLLGLWGDAGEVHMALLDEARSSIGVASLECPGGTFPSVGVLHPPAIRLERAVRDLFGLTPEGAVDARPWLDHGRWGTDGPPLKPRERTSAPPPSAIEPERFASSWITKIIPAEALAPADADAPPEPAESVARPPRTYAFLPVEGDHLHQIPVGPVHAGIIEPGHFRFTANGETVVRLEQRLGYVHKGIEALCAGATLERAAELAGRASGDSTVAYAIAFAHAVEAALDLKVPRRAQWLRALMAELERIANHLGDIGAICNDASFSILHAECGILREHVLRTAHGCFGHRLMRDRVVPGGVAADLDKAAPGRIEALVGTVRRRFPQLVDLYDNTASLQDRTVATGILRGDFARQFGAGGYVGRASGRAFDARLVPSYPPYPELRFELPVLHEGDVNARVWIRIREVEASLGLIAQIMADLPDGPVQVAAPAELDAPREGLGLAEAFRGDVLAWVRIGPDGRIARCHLRDASWFQWPLLEAAIEGNIVADFPLCNKCFRGHDGRREP